jgi:hypothetical protein
MSAQKQLMENDMIEKALATRNKQQQKLTGHKNTKKQWTILQAKYGTRGGISYLVKKYV